jgi:hypothetical protein
MLDRLRVAMRIAAPSSRFAQLEAAVEQLADTVGRLEERVAFLAEENRRLAEALLDHVEPHVDMGGHRAI